MIGARRGGLASRSKSIFLNILFLIVGIRVTLPLSTAIPPIGGPEGRRSWSTHEVTAGQGAPWAEWGAKENPGGVGIRL